MRHGGSPNCATVSGRVRSASSISSAASGAPNAASAAQTRVAFSADASIHTSRSTVARGTPWAARRGRHAVDREGVRTHHQEARVGATQLGEQIPEVLNHARLPAVRLTRHHTHRHRGALIRRQGLLCTSPEIGAEHANQ